MPTQTSPSTAKKGYETRDVPVRPWAWFTLGFAGSLLIVILGTFVFTKFLAAREPLLGEQDILRTKASAGSLNRSFKLILR